MPRPASFYEPDILTRCMLLFWQQGFNATSIRDLEHATNLKASSLYNRFESKEALFLKCLEHYIQRVVKYRIDRYLKSDDPLIGLRAFFEATFEYLSPERAPMACFLSNTALEMGNAHDQIRPLLAKGGVILSQGFVQCLERAQRQGLLADDININREARQLYTLLQGMLIETAVHPEPGYLAARLDEIMAIIPLSSAS